MDRIAKRLEALESTAFAHRPAIHTEWLKSISDADVDLLARIAVAIQDTGADFDEACKMAGLTADDYQRLGAIDDDFCAYQTGVVL